MSAYDVEIGHKLVTNCISTSSLAPDSSDEAILVRACTTLHQVQKRTSFSNFKGSLLTSSSTDRLDYLLQHPLIVHS